jgi:hypothetical protein
MAPQGLGCGYDSAQAAVALKSKVSPLEQDLIDAIATRSSATARDSADPTKLSFGNPPELNVAFAEVGHVPWLPPVKRAVVFAKIHSQYIDTPSIEG